MSKQTSITAAGHSLWAKVPKANTELFALTYGSLITELLRDYDQDITEINSQLERIGYSIGVRCIDELLAKSEVNGVRIPTCKELRDTAEVVAKIGFRMFLGMNCDVGKLTDKSFSLFLDENPLSIFVELPQTEDNGDGSSSHGPDWSKLKYSNIYCGVIRGALEQVNLKVECDFVRDTLRGDEASEIKVEVKEVLADGAGDDYHEE
mmetsp:Transcript_25980/g.38461  ORF Transcript_25980/g.38461 Transcript_25980/m.38461 type:complete len:207 (+) Transcript_25980:69-689(+)